MRRGCRWHKSPDYRTDRKAWKRKREWLAREIKNTPKPKWAYSPPATDWRWNCWKPAAPPGIAAVPEEVAIVGAGNSLLAVDAMHTPISSVDMNMELLGYRGAALLDDLMSRRRVPPHPARVTPFRLIVRKSSDLVAVNHPGIARSLRFIPTITLRPSA